MTEGEFLERIRMPLGARLADISFMPENISNVVGVQFHQSARVICWVLGKSEELALTGAQACLRAVDGLETYVRVAPDAATQTDFATNEVRHIGYVRFSFFDRPGGQHEPEPPFAGFATVNGRVS